MRIVIFAPSKVHALELAGLTDVFAEANARVALAVVALRSV
jgi:putative intracellular protease/amidase